MCGLFIYGNQYLHQQGKPRDRTAPLKWMMRLHHRLAKSYSVDDIGDPE